MPNWCSNNLKITGNIDRLQQFRAENVKDDGNGLTLDFNFVAPLPDDQQENWYEWQCKNWGTKWTGDVYNVDTPIYPEQGKGELIIGFSTAWSPPEPWLEKASIKYPDLHFHLLYQEEGLDFGGYFVADNGITAGECAGLEKVDEETGRPVRYDDGLDRYVFDDTGEVIEDEDYYPEQVNAFTESI
jgi:hypothetical protein